MTNYCKCDSVPTASSPYCIAVLQSSASLLPDTAVPPQPTLCCKTCWSAPRTSPSYTIFCDFHCCCCFCFLFRGLYSGTVIGGKFSLALLRSCCCLMMAGSVCGCLRSPSAMRAWTVSRMSLLFSSLSGYFSHVSVTSPFSGLYLRRAATLGHGAWADTAWYIC